ncbi:RNA polymerase sigma factor [Chryseosolibacter indicus]|uniref:Sigma-70 family RNA polymerase sigma factor n=1 Tax=Chryseosolibacter indicus TaxID=2782351 RepID=A0ABS5VW96_9BACT|nr:sigma-70 family RNA polymerase sigma factor [Chryseosolibacter indicus]MBT1705004.1 sigma-70 family RNA polymerase sigma factor [Chryseosolibacter indicus]
MTDRELVYQCGKGDAEAQRILYDLYKYRLMGICRRYTSGREEAQDVLQEVFIKIFTKINQLDNVEKLENWLIKITVNTAVNYYHHAKRLRFDSLEEIQAESGDYELILSNVSDEFLLGLINALPDGCRVVFNLYIVEGYSHAEIAEMLNISESTSRSQLVYAKNILKDKLSKAGVLRYEKYA